MRRSINWPPITERPYPSGELGYVVNVGMISGKRVRPAFRTRAEAEEYAKRCRIEKENEGKLAFMVPVEVRLEAANCMAKLAPYEASLTEATDFYIQHVLEHRKAPVISKMIDDLLQEKERARCRATTIHTLESFLCKFADRFGERQLHTVELPELSESCLVAGLAPRTQFNRIRIITPLYISAWSEGWVSTNLARKIVVPVWDPAEPGVLRVDQAQQLLGLAAEFALLPYICIGLFAGLRRCELTKLDWTALKREDREIVVGASIAKTRSRRVVPYGDALAAWLELCPAGSGLIVEADNLEDCFSALRKAAGIVDWPHNALRHSFASYHLAFNKDPVRTAFLMGHTGSTDMLHNNYKGLVSTADAQRFWALLPTLVMTDSAQGVACSGSVT